MKRILFALLLPLLTLHAETVPLEQTIQPRAADAVWNYAAYDIINGNLQSGGTATEKVVEVREIEGKTVYRIELLFDPRTLAQRLTFMPVDPENYSYFWEYIAPDEGSYNFSEDYDSPTPPESLSDFTLTMPYPVESGHTFGDDSTRVLAVSEEIEVPAGTFKTVVYETAYPDEENPEYAYRDRYFMAPGVGLVRFEMDDPDGAGGWTLVYREDLVSYSMGEEAETEK